MAHLARRMGMAATAGVLATAGLVAISARPGESSTLEASSIPEIHIDGDLDVRPWNLTIDRPDEQIAVDLLFDGLTAVNPADPHQPLPALSTGWAFRGNTLVATLDMTRLQGLGRPMTADDVAASLKRSIHESNWTFARFLGAHIGDITAPDAQTVELNTDGTLPDLPAALADPALSIALDGEELIPTGLLRVTEYSDRSLELQGDEARLRLTNEPGHPAAAMTEGELPILLYAGINPRGAADADPNARRFLLDLADSKAAAPSRPVSSWFGMASEATWCQECAKSMPDIPTELRILVPHGARLTRIAEAWRDGLSRAGVTADLVPQDEFVDAFEHDRYDLIVFGTPYSSGAPWSSLGALLLPNGERNLIGLNDPDVTEQLTAPSADQLLTLAGALHLDDATNSTGLLRPLAIGESLIHVSDPATANLINRHLSSTFGAARG